MTTATTERPTLDDYNRLVQQALACREPRAIGIPYFALDLRNHRLVGICPLCGNAFPKGVASGRHWKTHERFLPNTDFLARWLEADERLPAAALQWMQRERANLRKPTVCVGCYLGDAAPTMHDYGYGCQYGEGMAL